MRFSPQVHAIFRHQNFKKLPAADVFCTFSLTNVLLATAACNLSTSNFKKCSESVSFFEHFDLEMRFSPQPRAIFRHQTSKSAPRASVFFNILTWKCASGHSRVQFFDIDTSKSAPRPSVFENFDLDMSFWPQPRAIFRHQNSKKCSEPDLFCKCSLQNALFATAACNFSTSELQKVLRTWRVLYIFTSKCAFRHNGVNF